MYQGMKTEMTKFFDFGSKLVQSTVMASPTNVYDHTKLINGDYAGVDFPVIYKQDEGENFLDILDTRYTCLYLI